MNSHYKKVGTISYGDDQIVLVKCVGGVCMMNEKDFTKLMQKEKRH